MGTADRIERERSEKRTRILEAARELFVERGVDAVTLREIAQRIEYSTTAIYVHFKDKAALLEAMVNEDFATFSSGLEQAARIPDPVERLRTLHDAYVDFALEMPRHYQLLFMTPSAHEHHHAQNAQPTEPAGVEGYRVLRATIAECMADGLLRPELDDVDAVAQIVWANVHGLVSLLISKGDEPMFHWRPRATLAKLSSELVLAGLLRDRPPAGKKPAKKR